MPLASKKGSCGIGTVSGRAFNISTWWSQCENPKERLKKGGWQPPLALLPAQTAAGAPGSPKPTGHSWNESRRGTAGGDARQQQCWQQGCCMDTNTFITNWSCPWAQDSHHCLSTVTQHAFSHVSPPPLSYYSLPLLLSFFPWPSPSMLLHSSEITGAQNKRLLPLQITRDHDVLILWPLLELHVAQGRAWAQLEGAEPLPEPPGRWDFTREHAGLPDPKKQTNKQKKPHSWVEEKHPCDFPVKSKGERQGWSRLPMEERLVPLPKTYTAGSAGGAGLPLCPRTRRWGGPERYTLQVKWAAAFSLVHTLLKIPEKKPREELHPL